MSKSVVIELQEEAMNTNSSVTEIITKAYVIARKLKLIEFEEWLQYELNGYEDFQGDEWPPYRIILGELRGWNPYRGWIPIIIQDAKIHDLICNQKVNNALSGLEEMINGDNTTMVMPLNPKVCNLIAKNTGFETKYSVFINRTSVKTICDKVRNLILEWSLKLEEEGIEGDGMKFNKEEKEKAKEIGYTVNNFFGNINQSQIQQNTSSSSQSMSYEVNKEDITNLLKELKSNYKSLNLEKDKISAIEENIISLEGMINDNDFEKSKVSKVLISLKNILEGTTGSILASGLIYMISQLLAK